MKLCEMTCQMLLYTNKNQSHASHFKDWNIKSGVRGMGSDKLHYYITYFEGLLTQEAQEDRIQGNFTHFNQIKTFLSKYIYASR